MLRDGFRYDNQSLSVAERDRGRGDWHALERSGLLWLDAKGGVPCERIASEGSAAPSLRCAIYTRKSTEEGLDQDFSSLDAQREAAEAFINSQRREGWIALPDLYDDGGFTGANMDRPALKRLLVAVEAGGGGLRGGL